jgi:hypothetical protein
MEVRIRVGSSWSKYFTYGVWGLGNNNYCTKGQTDTVAYLNEDTITPKGGVGNAFQYRITLKRTAASILSPKFSLAANTLVIAGITYTPDTSSLPDYILYDVPILIQTDVPVIGGSICSPTTATMLLKYKGENFTAYDTYEHRYIANLFKDYANNIYGSWSYCTIGIGAYGYDAYVQSMASWEEMQLHLATVGPIGVSIAGSKNPLYSAGGHLILARGYRVVNGETFVICNDPYITASTTGIAGLRGYYEYPLATFLNFWNNSKITYVVE